MEKIIELETAVKLKDFTNIFSSLDESYVFSHIHAGEAPRLPIGAEPLKIGGVMLMLVLDGSPFELELNLSPLTVSPGALVAVFPGTVARMETQLPADLDAYLLFFDAKFLQNVNLNTSAIVLPPVIRRPSPILRLDDDETDRMRRYFDMLHLNSTDQGNPQISKNIATSIMAAMFYQIVQFHHKRISDLALEETSGGTAAPGRRNEYVRKFIKLVHLHHVKERSVAFYADKMFISAKYLTLLVKEATGQSAARWIDEFVIMEAKNLLRFSGKNIQQVAYALNFSTQSSFGKYFKHLTGMSPSEFQRS